MRACVRDLWGERPAECGGAAQIQWTSLVDGLASPVSGQAPRPAAGLGLASVWSASMSPGLMVFFFGVFDGRRH
jgi:hypothetical protein